MLQRFDGYRLPLAMKRIVLRHVTEAASQRLMIENGDIDVARDLSPDDLDTLSKAGKIKVTSVPQATLMYLGLNNKNPNLAKPEVQEAMKWLIDYQGIQKNVIRTTYKVHRDVPAGRLPRRAELESVSPGRREGEGAAREGRSRRTASR